MGNCSTDERLQQETLCHRQWTDECPEVKLGLPVAALIINLQSSLCWVSSWDRLQSLRILFYDVCT